MVFEPCFLFSPCCCLGGELKTWSEECIKFKEIQQRLDFESEHTVLIHIEERRIYVLETFFNQMII